MALAIEHAAQDGGAHKAGGKRQQRNSGHSPQDVVHRVGSERISQQVRRPVQVVVAAATVARSSVASRISG